MALTMAERARREAQYAGANLDPATNPNVIIVTEKKYDAAATTGLAFTEDDATLIATALRWAAEHAPGSAGAELLEQSARFERAADRARMNGAKKR